MPDMVFDNPRTVRFETDTERRTIRGLALPFGDIADNGAGRWAFAPGTLTWTRPKVLDGHDWSKAVGTAELAETDEGLLLTAKIARGQRGDEVLGLAQDGVLDGLSVGLGNDVEFDEQDGVRHVTAGTVREVSLTPIPAFERAAVRSVAASAAAPRKEQGMPEQDTAQRSETAPDFAPVVEAIRAGFAGLNVPAREVAPAGAGVAHVAEQPLYRFDGLPGLRSFAGDIRDALFSGDSEARGRLDRYMGQAFAAVDSSDVSSLNPATSRPDLYVGQLDYPRPLWDSVSTGSIADKTPFSVPKFASAGTLTAPHTEGTEPADATFTATSQTITPGAVSGRAVLSREIVDSGGNPQVDQILWNAMVGSYFEDIENAIKTALSGVATTEIGLYDAASPNASLVDAALIAKIESVIVAKQFVRGGNRFTGLVCDGQLFPALAGASDSTGRKLLPVVGPANADGSTTAGFDAVRIGNLTARASWALGSGNDAKSYLFVPGSVYAWASAPRRFSFEYQVSSVTLAIWGYSAAAVLRDSDVQPLDYTNADA